MLHREGLQRGKLLYNMVNHGSIYGRSWLDVRDNLYKGGGSRSGCGIMRNNRKECCKMNTSLVTSLRSMCGTNTKHKLSAHGCYNGTFCLTVRQYCRRGMTSLTGWLRVLSAHGGSHHQRSVVRQASKRCWAERLGSLLHSRLVLYLLLSGGKHVCIVVMKYFPIRQVLLFVFLRQKGGR